MSSQATSAGNRRSTRLTFSVPIVIHGKDAQQKAFRENTHTIIVNKHGAKLLTSQQLVVGTEILVENPTLGSVAKANVVWISAERNPSGLQEVGVQLVESQNIWGLEFPPGDWTAAEEDRGATAANGVPALRPQPVASVPAQTPRSALTSEEIATRLLQELHETADAYARQFHERLDHVVQRVGAELEIDLHARANAARAQELSVMEQQILASSGRLSTLRAEMEELDAKLAQSQQNIGTTLDSIPLPLTSEQIYEKVEAEALPVLHLITESGIAAARERFQAQMQADAGQAAAAWRSNLHAERDSVMDEARQQLMMAVSSALETLNRERDAAQKEIGRYVQEEFQANKERVASQIRSKLDVTAENHSAALMRQLNETVRETGERQAKLLQDQFDALLVSRLEQAQRHVQSLGVNLETNVADELRAVGERSSQEIQSRLQDIADKTVASTSNQICSRVEESAQAAAEKVLQSWEARLQAVAETVVEQMRAQIEEAARSTIAKGLQAWQTQLQEVANKTISSSSAQISARVDESAQTMAKQALAAWQVKLRENADQTAASLSDQVQGQIKEAVSLLGPKLREMQERAVNEAFEAFRGRLSQLLGLLPSGGK